MDMHVSLLSSFFPPKKWYAFGWVGVRRRRFPSMTERTRTPPHIKSNNNLK